VSVSQTLRHGTDTRNGITEFSLLVILHGGRQCATYIPREAITLGIGLHSSFILICIAISSEVFQTDPVVNLLHTVMVISLQ